MKPRMNMHHEKGVLREEGREGEMTGRFEKKGGENYEV